MHPFEKYLVYYIIVSLTYAFVLLESFFKFSNFNSIVNKVWYVRLLLENLVKYAVKLALNV